MTPCPNCQKLTVFPGATDCPRCGYFVVTQSPSEPPVLGTPLFPQYREPPRFVPLLLAVVACLMVAVGIWMAMTPGEGSWRGKGAILCGAAATLYEVLFGVPNVRIAEASLWVAFGLGFAAAAWHLYAMWFRGRT